MLSSTLLGSTRIQELLNQDSITNDLPDEPNPLISESQQHSQSNTHRLAFSVTTFPFTDPSPNTSNAPLLGIRIDICSRGGKFDKPYYLLLKRAGDSGDEWRIHRHTIPQFIPLRDYENQFLPLRDEGYGSEVSNDGTSGGSKQDLHELVRKVRQDLVSWMLRRDAIELLQEELGLAAESPAHEEVAEAAAAIPTVGSDPRGRFGMKSLSATSVEARFATLAWQDGRAGRVKISDQGLVQRAVIFGEEGRMKQVEDVLISGDARIEELAKKLEMLDEMDT